MLKKEETISRLEQKIGTIVQKYKSMNTEDMHPGALNHFDSEIYDHMLEIKSSYNKLIPFDRDPVTMTEILNSTLKFLRTFYDRFKSEMTDKFKKMIIEISHEVRKWKVDTLHRNDQVIEIQELPMTASNDYPQVTHIIQDPHAPTIKSMKEKASKLFEDDAEDLNTQRKVDFSPIKLHNPYEQEDLNEMDNLKEIGISGVENGFEGIP